MNLSKNFDQSRMFTAVRFFDGLPLVEEDLHQLQDKERFKTQQLLSGLYYQGIFGDLNVEVTGTSQVTLNKNLVSLGGELFTISGVNGASIPINLTTLPPDLMERISSVCIEGFFEEITTNSKISEYGGLDNTQIDPVLVHPTLGIQVSTRYQFKWRIRVLEGVTDLSLVVPKKKDGTMLTGKSYAQVEDETCLFEVSDDSLETQDKKMYLIRLFRVSQKDYKEFDIGDIIPEDTAKVHRNGHGWMGAKRITLGEMKEDQVRLFEMRGLPLDIYKIKTI